MHDTVPTRLRTFEQDNRPVHSPPNDNKTSPWDTLIPTSGGWVLTDGPARYNLSFRYPLSVPCSDPTALRRRRLMAEIWYTSAKTSNLLPVAELVERKSAGMGEGFCRPSKTRLRIHTPLLDLAWLGEDAALIRLYGRRGASLLEPRSYGGRLSMRTLSW